MVRINHPESPVLNGKVIPVPRRHARGYEWVFYVEQGSAIEHRGFRAPFGIDMPIYRYLRTRPECQMVHCWLKYTHEFLVASLDTFDTYGIQAQFGWRHRLYLPREHWNIYAERWYEPVHVPDKFLITFQPDPYPGQELELASIANQL